jgi:hypothetical protein
MRKSSWVTWLSVTDIHVNERGGVSLAFIDEYKTEVVSCRVLFVDFAKRWSQVESPKEESDGYSLA